MATWNPPTDLELAVTKPTKASNHRRIRDLVTALAEGASGAPKISLAATNFASSLGKLSSLQTIDTSGAGETVIFDTLVAESETILNTSTGEFTVPYDGMIKITTVLDHPSNDGTLTILVNGSTIFTKSLEASNNQHEFVFHEATANDVCKINLSTGGGAGFTLAAGSYASVEYISKKS